MGIQVIDPGILTTVQDGGRIGYQQYGVTPSGPMDERAFALANLLTGNQAGTEELEMTLKAIENRTDRCGYETSDKRGADTHVSGGKRSRW